MTQVETTAPPIAAKPPTPSVIPDPEMEGRARTLVLCFDGTGDQFDDDNTNVVKFFELLKRDDRSKQMVYYQAGLGTHTYTDSSTPISARLSKFFDKVTAWNIKTHILGGYEFLMQNYEVGDKICIFGFSRGAYIARSLAAMIATVGLLPACNYQQVPFAYAMYMGETKPGLVYQNEQHKVEHQALFRKTFSTTVTIEFLGVWDTVASVGVTGRNYLPGTKMMMAGTLKTLRHALSADERRSHFEPFTYLNSVFHPQKNETSVGEKETAVGEASFVDVREVWFAGCHCDVGGGSVKNYTKHSLARIPLRWMIRECFATKTGILFQANYLGEIGMDPSDLYPVVRARTNVPLTEKEKPKNSWKDEEENLKQREANKELLTEEQHDILDALCPIYDRLRMQPLWWVAEFLKGASLRMGKGRTIPHKADRDKPHQKHEIRMHQTVFIRQAAEHVDYKGPRLRFAKETPIVWET